jgi:hypothetical protein
MKLIIPFVLAALAFGADKFEVQKLMDVDTFAIPKTETMTIVKSVETKIVKTFRDTSLCVKIDTIRTTVLDTVVDVQKVVKKVKKAVPQIKK